MRTRTKTNGSDRQAGRRTGEKSDVQNNKLIRIQLFIAFRITRILISDTSSTDDGESWQINIYKFIYTYTYICTIFIRSIVVRQMNIFVSFVKKVVAMWDWEIESTHKMKMENEEKKNKKKKKRRENKSK